MGDYSHPAWMDVDGDGLMDMVCGVRENKALEELPQPDFGTGETQEQQKIRLCPG